MKEIPLTQGHVALVDDADFEAVNAFKWGSQKRGRCLYGARTVYKDDGSRTTLYLHQFLMGTMAGKVDHKDGNGLNNQRYNLRPATDTQNKQAFQHKRKNTFSCYRGVSCYARGDKFEAKISVNKKTLHLGTFTNETDAALAYDAAAREFFGEFASPNFKL